MTDIFQELQDIGRLIDSAKMLNAVRREVHAVMGSKTAIVANGKLSGRAKFDVVVDLRGETSHVEVVARRIQATVPDVQVEKIVDGLLGVRTARRGRSLNFDFGETASEEGEEEQDTDEEAEFAPEKPEKPEKPEEEDEHKQDETGKGEVK